MKKTLVACLAVLFLAIVLFASLRWGSDDDENSVEAYQLEVLQALKGAGAKLYVTPATCPHCRHQEDVLGTEAEDYIEIIDCMEQACPGIDWVPTWIINGETYVGAYELCELAVLVGLEEDGIEKGIEGTTPLE